MKLTSSFFYFLALSLVIFNPLCVGAQSLTAYPSESETVSVQAGSIERSPAKDPPVISVPVGLPLNLPARSSTTIGAPSVEWTFHKTADGLHPDGREQQVMWLMNRARVNPSAEGYWLATSTEPDVADGRDWFGVNTTVLRDEFNSYSAKPPAAFDVRLYNAAKAHSDWLIATNTTDPAHVHDGQFTRINTEGFQYWSVRGNVFLWADSSLNAHAAWNIDWGSGPGTDNGMQTGRGHRQAIMSLDGDYTNVGVALVLDGASMGPYVSTGNYANANSGALNHYNQFIVGTVWRDTNGNGRYDPGEGIGGVTVRPSAGTYYAVTGSAGGYAIPVTMAPGTYPVTFSGSATGTKSVTIGSGSALLDLKTTPGPPPVYKYWIYLPLTLN